ncbi:hypothetical protein H6G33_32275 [Calothrix sp. FACHB-1219]|uniref:hypothetical protein n=1 Tax=unclassified Calothrix TaxID=2619626 RepID=UPI001689B27A|nr:MULTISPECIES: hypothetical protein [unclassified Calothrix]MBD2207031.1 hypothetical protein [Calothrix sp. FACHB-168]MBD2221647.1 hypothetical protein [Calothrix sp. FACHB-1219]
MQDGKRYTTFRAASTAFNRTETILKMVTNFLDCFPQDLANTSLQQLTNFDTLTAMDVYDRPIAEVSELMRKYKIKSNPREVDEAEACSLRNFRRTSWNIPSGSSVDLLIYQGNVVGVHQSQGEQPPIG